MLSAFGNARILAFQRPCWRVAASQREKLRLRVEVKRTADILSVAYDGSNDVLALSRLLGLRGEPSAKTVKVDVLTSRSRSLVVHDHPLPIVREPLGDGHSTVVVPSGV